MPDNVFNIKMFYPAGDVITAYIVLGGHQIVGEVKVNKIPGEEPVRFLGRSMGIVQKELEKIAELYRD